jgi:hypothetical protein
MSKTHNFKFSAHFSIFLLSLFFTEEKQSTILILFRMFNDGGGAVLAIRLGLKQNTRILISA